jgi:hypothetical protein
MTPDEAGLLQELRDGRGDQFSFAGAARIISGVHDPAKRQQHLAQIAQITDDAKPIIANCNTIRAKARELMK